MDSLHVEGMAQDEGNALFDEKVGDPVLDEHAFHGDYELITEGIYNPEKNIQIGFYVSVK